MSALAYSRFFKMLDQVPRIRNLWNQAEREMHIEAFERELRVMSSGEVHIAKFFASVWLNNNKRYGFDIVDAIASLDTPEIKLIAEWINDPFWP